MDTSFVDHNFVDRAKIGCMSSAGNVDSANLVDLVDHEQRTTCSGTRVYVNNETGIEYNTGLGCSLSGNVHDTGTRNFHQLSHLEFAIGNLAKGGEFAGIDFDIRSSADKGIDDRLLTLELREQVIRDSIEHEVGVAIIANLGVPVYGRHFYNTIGTMNEPGERLALLLEVIESIEGVAIGHEEFLINESALEETIGVVLEFVNNRDYRITKFANKRGIVLKT